MVESRITRRTLFSLLVGAPVAPPVCGPMRFDKEWVCAMFEVPMSIAFGDGNPRELGCWATEDDL